LPFVLPARSKRRRYASRREKSPPKKTTLIGALQKKERLALPQGYSREGTGAKKGEGKIATHLEKFAPIKYAGKEVSTFRQPKLRKLRKGKEAMRMKSRSLKKNFCSPGGELCLRCKKKRGEKSSKGLRRRPARKGVARLTP